MNLFYGTVWCLCRGTFPIYFRWRAFDTERVPPTGPALLTANHCSYLDPLLIGASVPREIHYLARASLFSHRFLQPFVKRARIVPIQRDKAGTSGLKATVHTLNAGHPLVIFPEGTRSRDGRLQPAQAGIGWVIARSAAPVVPVRIFGNHEAFARHHWFPRPYRITVRFGDPLDFKAARREVAHASPDRLRSIYAEIAAEVTNAIARIQDPIRPAST